MSRGNLPKVQAMPDHTDFTLEQVLAAVEKGITTYGTARALGCHPDTIRRYSRRWKSVADALQGKRRELVDLAELGLRGAVLSGQPWAITFALRTLGRETYGDKLQVEFINSPEWKEMRMQIINILRPYPEALRELADKLPDGETKQLGEHPGT